MTFVVGIDIGTTYVAAAVFTSGRAETAVLGARASAVPSVVFVDDSESFVAGEPASALGLNKPERLIVEFKRRFGDDTPFRVGDVRVSATELVATTLRDTLDTVASLFGGEPSAVTLTHPATWGDFKLGLLRDAAEQAGVDHVGLIAEPDAAAIFYASQNRLAAGSVVAVYDLGGGTFDATVLKKTVDGFALLGEPQGDPRCGGIDFDQMLFAHVTSQLGGRYQALDDGDPGVVQGKRALFVAVANAKELLSSRLDVVVPVNLPALNTEVRVTRAEFEELIEATVESTFDVLDDALDVAGTSIDDLDSILLIGGSSRIPFISAALGRRYRKPLSVDAHPKFAVCLGAAIAAGADQPGQDAAQPTAVESPKPDATPAQAAAPAVQAEPDSAPVPAISKPVGTDVPDEAAGWQPTEEPLGATTGSEPVAVEVDLGSQGLLGVNSLVVVDGPVLASTAESDGEVSDVSAPADGNGQPQVSTGRNPGSKRLPLVLAAGAVIGLLSVGAWFLLRTDATPKPIVADAPETDLEVSIEWTRTGEAFELRAQEVVGSVELWTWTFPGGAVDVSTGEPIAQSNLQQPPAIEITDGDYDVSLMARDSSGESATAVATLDPAAGSSESDVDGGALYRAVKIEIDGNGVLQVDESGALIPAEIQLSVAVDETQRFDEIEWRWELNGGEFITDPVGTTIGTRFDATGGKIVTVRGADADGELVGRITVPITKGWSASDGEPLESASEPLCGGFAVTISGTADDDVLVGTPGRDVIDALEGDDEIQGLGGDDIICAGPGDDVVDGGDGNDVVFAGAGNDVVALGSGDDSVRGGGGVDEVRAGAGNDLIYGGPGVDELDGGGGDDLLDAGADGAGLIGGEGRDSTCEGAPGDDSTVECAEFVALE